MSVCAGTTFELKEFNNLFIEMTSKNCNQRCKSCYIDFPMSKNIKDFIPIETIKEGLLNLKNDNLHCIYLTGAEPMLHPDFNSILRLCLKKCNVCICTNGSFLNEKKIRFLKKVEDEGQNQIFIKLALVHYDETENDIIRYRGNYRQIIHSLKILCRYNFMSVLNIQNYYHLEKNEIKNKLSEILESQQITNTDIQITESYPSYECETISNEFIPDCIYGRVLSASGVYSCPFLANDYRGRCGSDLSNFSKFVKAETDFCFTCHSNKNPVFAIG